MARKEDTPYIDKICSVCDCDTWELDLENIVDDNSDLVCCGCGNREKVMPGDKWKTKWTKKGD